MTNVFQVLQERGFIDQVTDKDLLKSNQSYNFYVGFDPTADSLHIGHLVGIMALSWLQKYGHKPYALIGGATGRIGDPSGKSLERPFLDDEIISQNVSQIKSFLEKTLGKDAVIINNNDWFKDLSFVDFLRDIGKQFRLGPMLSKESVRVRMESEEGMSFTEFSYQILQSYDFYHLFKHHDISLQMGGSDQWGNITAGVELVRKLCQKPVYGITFPLLTRSDGKKFGKTEAGAVWLAEHRLSPYQFYQYLVRIPDKDVINLLCMLTFMDIKEIKEIEKNMTSSSYVPNSAQKILAEHVTLFVHGSEGLEKAQKVTQAAAPGSDARLDAQSLKEIAKDMPNANLTFNEVIGLKFTDLAVKINLTTSKSEAVRLIKNNGAYLNNQKILDPTFVISEKDIIDSSFLLFGSGKKKKILVSIIK